MNKEEYIQLLKELRDSINALLEGFYDIQKEREKASKKIDISRPFSVLNFPSKGMYYPDRKQSVLIKYLTAVEEHVLTDSFLVESGRGIELVLDNLIIDDLDAKSLLTGDFQALLIFLRSTAYGDVVDIAPACPHCGKEAENSFRLSSLEFKEQKNIPDKDGKYHVQIPELELNFVISPMTFEKEIKKLSDENEDDFFVIKSEDGDIKVKKEKSLSLVYCIDSINGITDMEKIKKIVRKLPKNHFDELSKFIKDNESGVQDYVELTCPFCGQDFKQIASVGYNFISLPSEYKETILEEVFLITYYGKGITRQDAMSMPTYERRWHIRRISQELKRKEDAEKKAYSKAKSSGKKH